MYNFYILIIALDIVTKLIAILLVKQFKVMLPLSTKQFKITYFQVLLSWK